MGIAVVGTGEALVDIRAGDAITGVSSIARASERATGVLTSRIRGTIVSACCAFVDVATLGAGAGVAWVASACEGSDSVGACCKRAARVEIVRTLILVCARDTVTSVTDVARA